MTSNNPKYFRRPRAPVGKVAAGNVISATTRAFRLNDLVDGEFMIVASRGFEERQWFYMMPRPDVVLLHEAVTSGDVISVQRRHVDGSSVVLAKLARVSCTG